MEPQNPNPNPAPSPDLRPPSVISPTGQAVPPVSAPGQSPTPATSGQVVVGGFDSSASVLPGATAATPQNVPLPGAIPTAGVSDQAPGVVVGASEPLPPGMTPPPPESGRRSLKKPILLILILLIVLGGAASAYYFGYATNPSVIYAQALSNTGKGYDQLVTYMDNQSKINYKGVTGSGSYTLGGGSVATDGQLNFRSDGGNTDSTVNVNLGSGRLGLEFRTIKTKSITPDLYFKATGLNTLSSFAGGFGFGSQLNSLNNQWIVVDQSLLSNLQPKAGSTTLPSHAQILDEEQAFGRVNDQYVFTTAKSKAIFSVVKKFGVENIDGHKTYHYRVALDQSNIKQYITAQRNALRASDLNSWIKQNNYENYVDLMYDSLEQSANNISSKDTFDLWADMNTRTVYKIRVSDPTNPGAGYADIGVDYKGGSDYPFFLNIYEKDGGDTQTGSFVEDVNTQSNVVNLKLTLKGTGSASYNFSGNLNLKPTNSVTPITAPAGTQSLTQILNSLGLGSLTQAAAGGSNSLSGSAPLTVQN